MFLSNASIKRPVAMGCLIIALTILGFNTMRKIGLELMPKVDLPYLSITTIYPGATPLEIETDIAKPIEDQMVTIEGLKHIQSICMENVCVTMMEFNLDVEVDIASTDVRERLDLIRSDFPEDAYDPRILKYDINAKPIIQLALTGDLPLDEIYDYADNALRDRLTVISGVADVQLIGGAEREVQVLLDREKLAERGLTSTSIVQSIQQNIRTIPSGRIQDKDSEYAVKFDADYSEIKDLEALEVANRDGQRSYIRDIGRVEMGTEELRQRAKIDDKACIAIKIIKKADANAVKVVNRVRSELDSIKEQLPGGIELVWVTDDGTFIEATVNSAWYNVAQGIILTALILFLFLYNFRALMIIAITMPLTIIIGLFFIYYLDFTLNTPTLLAIGMSVGILVTNSIVVLEAIIKRLNQGKDPKSAARIGAGEILVAVLASAGTNVVVLFPIAGMEGIFGLFIRPFAMTMIIMTVTSLFISFTLTPLLSSLILKTNDQDPSSLLDRIEQGWNRVFNNIINIYGHSLEYLERHRWASSLLLIAVAFVLAHSFSIAGKLGSSMSPDPDRGEIFVKMEFPTRYNLNNTQSMVKDVEDRLKDLPHLVHMMSTTGKVDSASGLPSEGVYLAQITLKFPEKTDRKLSIHDYVEMVRTRLETLPDAIVTVSVPSMLGGTTSGLELVISGQDFNTLDKLALKAKELSKEIPGIIDQDTTVRTGKPELRIQPDREILGDMQTPATALGMTLRANLEGMEAGTFKQNGRNYDITVKMEGKEGKKQVEQFTFPGKTGSPILLTNIGQVEETRSPIQINRYDKQRISKLFTSLEPTVPLGTAVNRVSRLLEEKGGLPPGYGFKFIGIYEIMFEGQQEMAEAAIISIILVILTLSAIMESFKQPIFILVTVPLSIIGMIYGLALTGKSLEIFALMGGVMLIGIVVNNAILIMDRFNILVRRGVSRHQAMIQAACDRFRPVLMITMAAVLGMLPMAIGQGIGAELRNACGIASMGGILVSGLLTIFVVPVIYNLFTRRSISKAEE